MSLPSFDQVEATFTVRTKAQGLAKFADSLAKYDVLRPEHWRGDIAKACCRALEQFTSLYHPEPLVQLALDFTDHAFDLGEPDGYMYDNKIRENMPAGGQVTHAHDTIGAFSIIMPTVMDNGPMCQVIGPALLALEQFHPRLGQTVLSALDGGLDASCRACTPRSGYGWAQNVYWMGEADEDMRLEEEFDYLLNEWENLSEKDRGGRKKPEPDDVEMFRKRDYEEAIPDWAGTANMRPLSADSIAELRLPPAFASVAEITEELLRWLAKGKDHRNDIAQFEHTRYECCPYLLRWSSKDPLPQIWDDTMQDFSNSGEIAMGVNSIFGFHDEPTFKRALKRLQHFLEVLNLSENLIRALEPLKAGVRIPIRVHV